MPLLACILYAIRGVIAVHFFIYKASTIAGQQKALLKYDSLIVQPQRCHVPPELPSLQIAIYNYFAETSHPFIIAIASYIAIVS